MELAPICEEFPLSRTSHYIAGIRMPESTARGDACSMDTMYASLGVACLPAVVDGDCGLDVMSMMLGIPNSSQARKNLRIEISNYLMSESGSRGCRMSWLRAKNCLGRMSLYTDRGIRKS